MTVIPGKTPAEAAEKEAQKKADYVIPIYNEDLAPHCPIHLCPVKAVSFSLGLGCLYATVKCPAGPHLFNLNYDLESIDGLINK